MKITVSVQRSDEWVARKRLETGENVPKSFEAEVDTTDLSTAARQVLLRKGIGTWDGEYEKEYSFSKRSRYGGCNESVCPTIDTDPYTTSDVESAILWAGEEIATRMREVKQEKENKERQQQEEKRKKEEAEQRVAGARQLLNKELAQLDVQKNEIDYLGKFLKCISPDALQDAVSTMASTSIENAKEDIRCRIEDIFPFWVFTDGDD